MNILIIGGTRQVGHYLTERLLASGHRVTLLNRGITKDSLPDHLPRLNCDRTDPIQLKRALSGRTFDVVVDNVLFRRPEAESITALLDGRVGHYIALSSGQVYLVREGVSRPFREEDYAGPTLPPPALATYDYEEWLYGMDKRACEDVLSEAHAAKNFPATVLRLPMVHSARDQFLRLYSYVLRLRDGGPILVPDQPNHPIRHIYALDVVKAITSLIETGKGKGSAYNVSQDETLPISGFLAKLGEAVGVEPRIVTVPRERLVSDGFLPDCSPFSDVWMSELDNTRSKTELGMAYTPMSQYLSQIVEELTALKPTAPAGYRRRNGERTLAAQLGGE
ncbi:MAG: NAD-dependent epimerase/dehydratase family protein [Anaerolineae bacterium]|jgi:nucleoside-diphosphate-sugar epimerase|nr:NAD-dependent epimerase/dehydratase family protein [Anaerolineae bacterium]